jgi:hypothetical protein
MPECIPSSPTDRPAAACCDRSAEVYTSVGYSAGPDTVLLHHAGRSQLGKRPRVFWQRSAAARSLSGVVRKASARGLLILGLPWNTAARQQGGRQLPCSPLPTRYLPWGSHSFGCALMGWAIECQASGLASMKRSVHAMNDRQRWLGGAMVRHPCGGGLVAWFAPGCKLPSSSGSTVHARPVRQHITAVKEGPVLSENGSWGWELSIPR